MYIGVVNEIANKIFPSTVPITTTPLASQPNTTNQLPHADDKFERAKVAEAAGFRKFLVIALYGMTTILALHQLLIYHDLETSTESDENEDTDPEPSGMPTDNEKTNIEAYIAIEKRLFSTLQPLLDTTRHQWLMISNAVLLVFLSGKLNDTLAKEFGINLGDAQAKDIFTVKIFSLVATAITFSLLCRDVWALIYLRQLDSESKQQKTKASGPSPMKNAALQKCLERWKGWERWERNQIKNLMWTFFRLDAMGFLCFACLLGITFLGSGELRGTLAALAFYLSLLYFSAFVRNGRKFWIALSTNIGTRIITLIMSGLWAVAIYLLIRWWL